MITLTMKDAKINNIMVKLISKEIKVTEASVLLGLCKRQILRKKKAYLESGIESIPHKSKNKKTGRGYDDRLKNKIINLYNNEYPGWNFHHFNDFLEDEHQIKVSDTFIYNLFTTNKIDSPYKYKERKQSHPPRPRKENAGELLQCDASEHPWFYSDDKYYYLHGSIDDATNIVTGCYFAEQETTFGYQMVIMQTIKDYGIPDCIYTDYRTIFKSSKKELTLSEELDGKEIQNTKFARMLKHLGTDIISTSNPRAKGRIERLWKTFQDRLYKEMKKLNINTIKEANDFLLNLFLPKYNSRFASSINSNKNHFVCVDKTFDYNSELAVWEEKAIHQHCYLRINNKYHVIYKDDENVYINTKDKLRVYTFLDGTINVLYKNEFLKTKTVDIEFEKKLYIKTNKSITEINASKSHKPAENHPWRNFKNQKHSVSGLRYLYALKEN